MQFDRFIFLAKKKNLQGKSRNSFSYFGEFFSPENFVRKLIRIICAWSLNQLIFFASHKFIRLVEILLKSPNQENEVRLLKSKILSLKISSSFYHFTD